uniref:Uncharacterized protein n=1 Tax=Arion vulgaris TaxID=1028688 RepID=A0A0B7B2U1_9EUPU
MANCLGDRTEIFKLVHSNINLNMFKESSGSSHVVKISRMLVLNLSYQSSINPVHLDIFVKDVSEIKLSVPQLQSSEIPIFTSEVIVSTEDITFVEIHDRL